MILTRHKKFLPFSFVFLILFPAAAELSAKDWEEIRGRHFLVYFIAPDPSDASSEAFANEVLRRAEQYYERIGNDLGYQRHSGFWTWRNRVKVYIYPDHAAFIEATNQPGWSRGMADYTEKEIISYRWENEKGFLDALLPHELGHLIFRDFIGFKGEVPLWLDEGVAQWQELAKRRVVRQEAGKLLKAGRLIPLQKLTTIDTSRLYRGGCEKLVHEFYVGALSIVDFLLTRYGTRRFTNFCRRLRDGRSINEALRSSYPASIQNMDRLEEEWVKYIQEE